MKIEIFGHTDIGKKRLLNEDDFLCIQVSKNQVKRNQPIFLLAVADGIGGHAGGELASSLAIETLRKKIPFYLEANGSPQDWQRALETSFQEANHLIFQKASKDQELTGMGTTLVAALVSGSQTAVSNVGDSRAYKIKKEQLQQITLDHSWKAEQLRNNLLSEAEIQQSPFKNMITRSLGFESDVRVDSFYMEFSQDEYILLCTDGLYSTPSDPQVLKIFKKHKTPEKICRKLIKLANNQGGHDNITGVVAHFNADQKSGEKKQHLSDTVKLDSYKE